MCEVGGPRCKGYCIDRLRSAQIKLGIAKKKYNEDKSPENKEKLRKAKNALEAAKTQYSDSTAYIDELNQKIDTIDEKLENDKNLTAEEKDGLLAEKEECQESIEKCKKTRAALRAANKAETFHGLPGIADNNHTYSLSAVVNATNYLNGVESGEINPDDIIAGKNGTPQRAEMVELAQLGTTEAQIEASGLQHKQQYDVLEAKRKAAEKLELTRKEKAEMKKLTLRNKELKDNPNPTIEEGKEYEKNAARLKELHDKQAAHQAAFTPQDKKDRIKHLKRYNTACDAVMGRKLLAEGKLKVKEKDMNKLGRVLKENGYTEGLHGRGRTPSLLYKEKNPKQRGAKTWGKEKEPVTPVDVRSTRVASSYDSQLNVHYDATVTTGRLSNGRWVVITSVQGKTDTYGSEAGQGSHHREGLGRSTKDNTKTRKGSFPTYIDYSPSFKTKKEALRWRSKNNAELLGRHEYEDKVTSKHISTIVKAQVHKRNVTMAKRGKVSSSISDHSRPLQENIAGHNNPTL